MRPKRKPTFRAKAGKKQRALLRWVGGWSALALYLLAYAPAGLGLAALVGSFDGSHQVQVISGERGLALVLHHVRNCAGHRHGALARALTCIAQRASATNPDHVLQFSGIDTLSAKSQLVPPPLPGLEPPAIAATEVALGSSDDSAQSFARPRPPPGEGGPIRCLRSTVLLL
jgi:hypothetical protein